MAYTSSRGASRTHIAVSSSKTCDREALQGHAASGW